jgi:CNT family concentrative nucleoside transporter
VPDKNAIEAAARGAGEGLQLALNVGAMLVAFIALVAMVNAGLGWAGEILGYPALSLQKIFSWAFAPVAWLMGVPWSEAPLVASFLGEKVALNEFVAYISLTNHSQELSNRGLIIASYALCGFANFSSIGIQIGGIGAMAPERRSEIAQLGIKALIAGSLSTFLAAAIAGLLI